MPSIEEARGLLGEHIALLHDYAGGDPGWKNLLDDNVRGAADAYALAVLASVEMYIIDDAVVEAARAKIKALGK